MAFIFGTAAGESLVGTEGDDIVSAGAGEDTVRGLGGADAIGGGSGTDVLAGDDGDDSLSAEGGDDTLDGGAGADTLKGGDEFTLGGATVYRGGEGDDLIRPYSGFGPGFAETIDGGPGIDRLELFVQDGAGPTARIDLSTGSGSLSNGTTIANVEVLNLVLRGANRVTGGDHADQVAVVGGGSRLAGGAGLDSLTAEHRDEGRSDNQLLGGDGADSLFTLGGEGDLLDGGEGDDRIQAFDAVGSLLDGGRGDDAFTVTGERNLVVGGAGLDTLAFDNGMEPGAVIDLAAGRVAGDDGVLIAGVSGVEAVRVTGGARIVGDGEANILVGTGTGLEDRPFTFVGGGGDDLLAVRSAAVGARLDGGEGDDTLDGSLGADTFIGREGRDTVTYADAQAGVVVDLADGSLNAGEAAGDRFSQIENLVGSGFGDRLSANGGTNLLDGGVGDDRLQGNGGADTLLGGDGADTLEGGERTDRLEGGTGDDVLVGGDGRDGLAGGAGADVFVFEDLLDGGDRIFDFVSGEDRIRLDTSAFGVADPAAVALLDAAPDEGQGPVLVYAGDGALSFDADGAGAGEAVLVAAVQGRPPLAAADIVWA